MSEIDPNLQGVVYVVHVDELGTPRLVAKVHHVKDGTKLFEGDPSAALETLLQSTYACSSRLMKQSMDQRATEMQKLAREMAEPPKPITTPTPLPAAGETF